MSVIIGVDAGGTKTEAIAYTPEGQPLARAVTGTGNMVVNREEALGHVVQAIAQVSQAAGGPYRLYIGAAGIDTGNNRAELTAHLQQHLAYEHLRIINDAHLGLYAALAGEEGMIVIAGTGSIAYARRGRKLHRAGGWGQLLGDEGSGYDIVRRAFVAITLEHEGGTVSPLSQQFLGHLDTDVFGAVQFFHRAPKGESAALLPLVADMANSGDAGALELLRRAGENLGDLACRLYRHAGYDQPVQAAMKGSVLEHLPQVYSAFIETIAVQGFPIAPIHSQAPAPLGAVYLCKEELSDNHQ